MEQVRVHVDRPRCPYCHEDVRVEHEKRGCSRCMAWHHSECWEEAGERCAACGWDALPVVTPLEESEEDLRRARVERGRVRFARLNSMVGPLFAAAVVAVPLIAMRVQLPVVLGLSGGAALAVFLVITRGFKQS